MGLDETSQGVLEKIIDSTIANVQKDVKQYRAHSMKSSLSIKEESDFVLGLEWGHILATFYTYYFAAHKGNPTPKEIDEVYLVLIKRTGEIRDRILTNG